MEQEQEKTKHKTISQQSVARILIILFALMAFIAVAFSPIFVLRQVHITGNQYITNEEVCRIGHISIGENLFQLQTDAIKETLLKDLRVENVTVKRSFPSGLDINIEERIPLAIVACDYGYLDLGRDGVVLDAHRTLRDMLVPMINGVKLADLFVGDDADTDNIDIHNVLVLLNMLTPDERAEISEISIANPEHVVAYTTHSVQIKIGKLEDFDKKVEIIKSFLAEMKTAKHPIEYIDLEFSTPFIKFKQ